MKNQTVPTAEKYYFGIMEVGKIPTTPEMWLNFAHEYAVLFARHHREQQVEAIKSILNNLSEMEYNKASKFEETQMENACLQHNSMAGAYSHAYNKIDNAYKEDRIQ